MIIVCYIIIIKIITMLQTSNRINYLIVCIQTVHFQFSNDIMGLGHSGNNIATV